VSSFAIRSPCVNWYCRSRCAAGVEWIRDLPYANGHARHVLDVYRPATGRANAPVLLQIHGGGYSATSTSRRCRSSITWPRVAGSSSHPTTG
jgi:acetyl esterase/lipase